MIFLSMIFLSIYRHLTKNSGLGKGMESAAAATDDDMRCDFGRSDASSTPYFLAVRLIRGPFCLRPSLFVRNFRFLTAAVQRPSPSILRPEPRRPPHFLGVRPISARLF